MSVTAPCHYTTNELLRDGGSIHIRAIRPDDKQRLLALFEQAGVIRANTLVASAVATLVACTQRIGARLDGILLQRQVSSGIEAMVGVTTDPMFGPLLVCRLGGTLVEVLHDVTFRLTPVSDSDAAELLTELRARVLLDGYRGAAPGDREALMALILRISALVERVPELQEFDLNPVKVLPPGTGVIALDGRMRLTPLAPA